MGKVYSVLMRPIRTFNIENRAAKIISQKKLVRAPEYEYVQEQKKLVDKVNPNFMKDHYQKNAQLDQRLKDVFVTSIDPQEITKPLKDSKSLPENRFKMDTFSYFEPLEIPVGKCSLKQIITFIEQHKKDPVTYSIENIATEYKMDKKIIDNILKHFNLFIVKSEKQEIFEDDNYIQKSFDMVMKAEEEKKIAEKKKIDEKEFKRK